MGGEGAKMAAKSPEIKGFIPQIKRFNPQIKTFAVFHFYFNIKRDYFGCFKHGNLNAALSDAKSLVFTPKFRIFSSKIGDFSAQIVKFRFKNADFVPQSEDFFDPQTGRDVRRGSRPENGRMEPKEKRFKTHPAAF